jgi:hypothetical protein
MYDHKVHAHEVRARKMHTRKIHARESTPVRYTPIRCTLMSVAFSLGMKCQRTLSGNLALGPLFCAVKSVSEISESRGATIIKGRGDDYRQGVRRITAPR